MKFRVWQTVQPTNPEHSRSGQAGVVHAVDPTKPDEVVVKWDDGQQEAVPCSDLRPLN